MLRALVKSFRRNQSGQDLSEYCLLTALVALVAAAIFVYASGGIGAIWSNSNTSLGAAGTVAGAGASGGTGGATTGGDHGGGHGGDH